MKKIFMFGFLMLLRCNGEPNEANALSEALTITVLNPSITQAVKQGNLNSFTIGFRLVCVNAASDTVIDRIFTERFHSGESPNQFRKRIGEKMQNAIDAYQAEHTIFTSSAFTATAAILEVGLDGGM